MKRSDLKPGQMFTIEHTPFDRYFDVTPDVYVVLDASHEIGFWTGVQTRFGWVGPSVLVEVL